MVERKPAMAKFARPNTKGALLRDTLFQVLNDLRSKPIIWIQGPAGAGKTTLVSSYLEAFGIPCLWYQIDEGDRDAASFFYYLQQAAQSIQSENKKRSQLPLLTPEYLAGLSLFTRRFFEQLFKELNPERFLVFDNYQDVSDGTAFHQMVVNGLKNVPPGRQVMIMSREAPPGVYARLRANGDMALLTWDQLRLSLAETRGIAKLKGYHHLSEGQIGRLHSMCEGWAAGLLLLFDSEQSLEADSIFPPGKHPMWDDIFSYFAGEVFDRMAPMIQDLLLKTAFLTKVRPHHAARLTGNFNAEELLSTLSRNQHFVTRYLHDETIYRYHQLFRHFLIVKAARNMAAEERAEVQAFSARLLLESGEPDDAIALFISANDWHAVVDVILSNAENMVEQGRHVTLASWINCLPIQERARSAWLSYWLGVCHMVNDTVASRNHFSIAFQRFKERRDPAGCYSAWSGIIDSYIYEWGDMTPLDRWIEELTCLLERYPLPQGPIEAKVTSAMLCALMYRRPQHPDMSLWEDRVKHIILHAEDIRLKIILSSHLMLFYCWWIGGQEKAAFLVDILQHAMKDQKIAPFQYIVWRSTEGASLWMRNHFRESHDALAEGLATATKSGIHIWDFMLWANLVYWHLCQQNLERADAYLRKMRFILKSRRDLDISHFHYLRAYAQLCKNNLTLALEHINSAIAFAQKAGSPFPYHFYLTGKADILIEAGDYDQADAILREAFEFGRCMRSSNLTYQTSWLRALMCHRQGDRQKARKYLKAYLRNSRENSTVNHAWWRSAIMASLLAEALEAGIEVGHVKRLIREHALSPPKDAPTMENWPYKVRIYTLGHFSLLVDDRPVSIKVKGKNKPLKMLKVLIASQGHDIPDSYIADALWPDADGDCALQNFTITLHRLRKLIGYPQALHLKDRRVRLNPDLCWVDLWMLHHLFTKADRVLTDRKSTLADLQRVSERLRAAYKGPFLQTEEAPWAIGPRQRLHERWSQIARQLGKRLERERHWPAAQEAYRHILQIDPVAEWACQGAFRCGIELRQFGDALALYRRFKTHFKQAYGNLP